MLVLFSGCRFMNYKRIKGNGVMSSQNRNIVNAARIKLLGSYDVEITQGATTSVRVEADENILPYILTNENDGFLVIKSKDHINLSTENIIKIYITTAKLEEVHLSGSGNITGKSKFTGASKLLLRISGSGDMKMEVNTPVIDASISGSGTITLKGETMDESIHITGQGDFNADELKAENAKVSIAGAGDIRVFADHDLDINIAGAGSVYYKGSASVKQHVAGSGEIKKIN